MAMTASALGVVYAAVEGQDSATAMHSRCLARSQLRYVVGDTGFSYVAGYGTAFPQQIHHRDAACTLAEDESGDCGGEKCALLPCWVEQPTCATESKRYVMNFTVHTWALSSPHPHSMHSFT